VETIERKKNNWIDDVMRREGLLREVMEGRMEGEETAR